MTNKDLEMAIMVSVPSRGLSYLNVKIGFDELLFIVSVPSRGLSYLNTKEIMGMLRYAQGFRPLTGTLLSKLRLSFNE